MTLPLPTGSASPSCFDGREALALVFTGHGCPTAKSCEDRLIALQEAYGSRGLQLVPINSNNPYLSPPDTLARTSLSAAEKGFNFPYLKDETGAAARAYGAIHTPTVVLFDGNRRLRYRAASTMHGTRPGDPPRPPAGDR